MAADEETSEKHAVKIPAGASRPSKSAVSTAVISASCVSTNIVTMSADAAKGIANDQRLASFVGACVDCDAMPSASAKPARVKTIPTSTDKPTSVKPRAAESGSVVIVERYSVKRQAA